MFGKSGKIIWLMGLLILLVLGFSTVSKKKISWQEPYKKKDMTIITGSVQADFGKFELRWIIDADKKARLITLESPGAGELPPIEKKILLMVYKDGITHLFQEWYPLLNVKEPYTIRLITSVSTADLFSVLPASKLPPVSPVIKKTQHIIWGKVYSKNGIQYLQGMLKASFGTLNILWKKEAGRIPQLITMESPGAGELPPIESKLLPWMDETTGTALICQERQPQLNEEYTPYLWCLAKVKTSELLSGFNRLNTK